ncbi:metallophosphoesterase family protein [Anaerobacillus sp. MEB173]|uniref:metallophosphoesterase family protein n=1 Tax=Anaerobacillus sp. MEB173 TaxID=3383345 RepID=UPI003F9125A4
MKRIAFISDIHGNAVALDAVLADIKQKNIDQIIVLGDICYRGPEPKRSLEIIRELKTDVIKGNADEWVVRGVNKREVPDKFLEMMNKEREWTVSKLDEHDLTYLKQLPEQLEINITEDITIYAFHATPTSLFDIVLPNTDNSELTEIMLSHHQHASLYIYAHIHLPFIRYMNGKCVVNIGSVGLPFDGLAKASYAIVEANKNRFSVTIERVEYDTEKVVNQYKDGDYPNTELMTTVVRKGVSPFL